MFHKGHVPLVAAIALTAITLAVPHQAFVFALPEHVPPHNSAIIITRDDDSNNLSQGIGNQGNNVPDILIPPIGQQGDNVHPPR